MSIKISDIRENELLPGYIVDIIPNKCECGAEIVLTNSLKQAYCSSDTCYVKIANRMYKMAQKLGLSSVTIDICKYICKNYEISSPYQLFLMEQVLENEDNKQDEPKGFRQAINDISCRDKNMSLWEVVDLSCIPDIEMVAKKLFYGYNSIGDAFDDIEYDKASFIAEKLGIKSSETSVLAVNIYNQLMEHKDELMFGETQFNIIDNERDTIYIAIDGYIEGFKNKSEFIHYLNKLLDYKVNILITNTVSTQLDILVADKDIASNKVKAATKINNDYAEECIQSGKLSYDEIGKFENTSDLHPIGEVIAIVSSKELIERLKDMTGGA